MKYYVVIGRNPNVEPHNVEPHKEWRVWSSYGGGADRHGFPPVKCKENVAIYTEMSEAQREEWLRPAAAGCEWKIVEVELYE